MGPPVNVPLNQCWDIRVQMATAHNLFQIILSHAQINHHVHASLQIDLGIKPTVKRSYYVGKKFRDRILGSGCDVLKSLQSVKLRVTKDDGHEKQRI